MKTRRTLIGILLVGLAVFAIVAAVLRIRSEEQAIHTIIRTGGRVYYGFQEPRLSVRYRPNSMRAAKETVTDGDAVLATYHTGILPNSASTSTDDFGSEFDIVQPTAFAAQPEIYFEVRPLSEVVVPMSERILTDLSRRIECATVMGPHLDEQLITALGHLRRLRQLIVYDAHVEQQERLANELPNVEIIWR